MDDYLCISTKESNVKEFVTSSEKMASANRFNFNTKKSKSNVGKETKSVSEEIPISNILNKDNVPKEIIPEIELANGQILNETDNKICLYLNHKPSIKLNDSKQIVTSNKLFNWNGINFELNKENFFNILIYSKEDFDIKKYYSSININLPIVQNKTPDLTWLFKKISSILLTGHPWIYFVSSINDPEALFRNMEDVCKVVAFKLIYLCSVMCKYQIQPGQNYFIDIIDSSLKKLYFYFSDKLIRWANTKFFLDFDKFYSIFYGNIYKLYYNNHDINNKLIDFCPFFFKCIRRKIYRLSSNYIRKSNSKENLTGMDEDI